MADVFEDTASRLWWGVRRFFLVFLVTVPAAIAIFITAGASGFGREYRAQALVIATKQPLRIEAYAKLGESIFDGGTVAEKAVNDGRLSIKPEDLIPEHARLEPVQENIVYHVIGIHSSRTVAADIANAVANAFVSELNRAGPDVGTFAVQDIARVPEATADAVAGTPVLAVAGAAMGLLIGAAIVGMFLTIRRPVLGAEEASALVGAPIAGTPVLPVARGALPAGTHVPGLAATVKRLFAGDPSTVVLISSAGDEVTRTLLAQLIAFGEGDRTRTYLVPSPDAKVQGLYANVESDGRVVVSKTMPSPATWGRAPIVIDGPSAKGTDAPQLIPESAQIVLVVRQGAPRTRLLEIAAQFLPGEISSIVFARRGNAWPWLSSPRTPTGPDRLSGETPLSASTPAPTVAPAPATRPAPPATPAPIPAQTPRVDRPQLPGWMGVQDLEGEERILGARPQPPAPLLGPPRRDPRPPREINLDELGPAPSEDAQDPNRARVSESDGQTDPSR